MNESPRNIDIDIENVGVYKCEYISKCVYICMHVYEILGSLSSRLTKIFPSWLPLCLIFVLNCFIIVIVIRLLILWSINHAIHYQRVPSLVLSTMLLQRVPSLNVYKLHNKIIRTDMKARETSYPAFTFRVPNSVHKLNALARTRIIRLLYSSCLNSPINQLQI